MSLLDYPITPDAEELLSVLRRQGTPKRVHFLELFLDREVQDALIARFGLAREVSADAPFALEKRHVALQRFLGYDYVYSTLEIALPLKYALTADTAALSRSGGRGFMEEHRGPITSWQEFEAYPWPDMDKASDRALAWYDTNLPDDMCLFANSGAHYCEHLCWLMGYESLCYALFDDRKLVEAIYDKIRAMNVTIMRRLGQYRRIVGVWGSDDMGFKTSLLMSKADTRQFVLAGHKLSAEMAHERGWVYLLHSCGKLAEIMPELIEDVKIDAKHSFEDTIEKVIDAKHAYGQRLTLLGGIDMDFLCRASQDEIRARVRATLDACLPGGGYCLGSGNTIANYVPLENYLAMMDEGRRYRA